MPSTSELALETTLNDLANARLRDKAPGLINYLVGFQLLDSDEEGSKAEGVFGFEIDQSFYYIPVAYRNGEVKSLDSVYSVNDDLFMPLSEDTVNQLINRKSQKLGDPDDSAPSEKGIRQPDYRRLTMIPNNTTKLAAMQNLLSMQDIKPLVDGISFPEGARMLGLAGAVKRAAEQDPDLAAAITRFYALDEFQDDATPKVAATRRPVVLISGISQEGVEDLTDEQRRDVIRGGIAVMDSRPEVDKSMVWSTNTSIQLHGPGVNGLYDVLLNDGSIEPAFCGRLLTADSKGDVENGFVLTRTRRGLVPYRMIRTVRQYLPKELEKWLDAQGVEPGAVKVGDTVMFCGKTGEVSLPFTCEGKIDGVDGFQLLTGRFTDRLYGPTRKVASITQWDPLVSGGISPNQDMVRYRAETKTYGTVMDRCNRVVIREGTVTRLAYTGNSCVISDQGFRAIKLGTDNTYSDVLVRSDLGDFNTVRYSIEKCAQDVKVWRSGDGLINIRDRGPAHGYTKVAALSHLICGLGMSASDAKEILGSASMVPQGYWVKQAAELHQFPELQDESPSGFMSQHTPQQVPFETQVTSESPDNSEFYRYHSPFGGGSDRGPDTKKVVQRASEVGSKEVFDTAALSALIKSGRPTELVERFLPAMVAGMDRLGRLLFVTNWHYDEYKERFGSDLPDLIDNIRSTFEHLGDVVNKLKERSISGDADYFGVGSN